MDIRLLQQQSEEFEQARIATLLTLYGASQVRLQRLIAELSTSSFNRARSYELLRQIEDEVAKLNVGVRTWANDEITKSYEFGVDSATQAATEARLVRRGNNTIIGAQIHRQAIAVIAAQMVQDMVAANNSIVTNSRRIFARTQLDANVEKSINEAIAAGAIEGQTRRQVSNRILSTLERNAVDGKVVLSGGRSYDPATYAELVARTRTREAMTYGTINQAIGFGMDLVQVSAHSHPQIDPCTPYQGRVFSLSGSNPDFPPLGERPPFHPNCKHVLLPVTAIGLKDRGHYDSLSRLSKETPQGKMTSSQLKQWAKRNPTLNITSYDEFTSVARAL